VPRVEDSFDDGYLISDDPARLDRDVVHGWLAGESYWTKGIPRDVFERALDNSLCAGLYAPDGSQAGFARAVTDRATFAYIGDVWIAEGRRGAGLGKRLMAWLLDHPDLRGLRTKLLLTADAHSLYEPFGFERPSDAMVERLMIDSRPASEIYGP